MEHNNVFGYARFRGDKVYDLTPTKAFYVEDISGLYNVLSIKKSNSSAPTITVEKSTDGITWETMGTTSTTAITAVIPAYGKLYLRASATRWCSTDGSYCNTITASGRHNVGGNILSLLHGSTFTGYTRNLTSTNTYAFYYLFSGDTNIVSAENLILNTKLANNCYQYMFRGCTALTTAPALPATTLANACYRYMFSGCTSLTTAPSLPATTLATFCYASMFAGCTALTTAPSLPATTLAYGCYESMFYGCTSLSMAPVLPATTLAYRCYTSMFYNCSALTTAPSLPATTLATDCYQNMFSGCNLLSTAPSLPATTLADYCYQYMFQGCTSLTTAPTLPATRLITNCYSYMFYNCTHLNYIKCLATKISSTSCLTNWVSRVAATGTFIKDAEMTSWPTGNSGIPSGWTVRANGTIVSQDSNVATILTLGCDSGTAYYTINGGSHITINQDTTTIPITQAMNGQTLYVYAEYAGQSDEKTLTLSWTDYSPAVTISVSDNYATITSATADTILYRLGSSGNYSTYTGPIYIAETTTLYVQATKTVSGVDYTTNTSQNVTHTAIPPTNLQISCSGNTVTITADQAQTIQYRFSTSDPWTTYTAPFAITQTVTVYAQASNNDGTISGSQECVYIPFPVPVPENNPSTVFLTKYDFREGSCIDGVSGKNPSNSTDTGTTSSTSVRILDVTSPKYGSCKAAARVTSTTNATSGFINLTKCWTNGNSTTGKSATVWDSSTRTQNDGYCIVGKTIDFELEFGNTTTTNTYILNETDMIERNNTPTPGLDIYRVSSGKIRLGFVNPSSSKTSYSQYEDFSYTTGVTYRFIINHKVENGTLKIQVYIINISSATPTIVYDHEFSCTYPSTGDRWIQLFNTDWGYRRNKLNSIDYILRYSVYENLF